MYPSARPWYDLEKPCRVMKVYCTEITCWSKWLAHDCTKTSTKVPGENRPTADHAINFTRRPDNSVKQPVNFAIIPGIGQHRLVEPQLNPTPPLLTSDAATEPHRPSPLNQPNHATSKPTSPENLSSMTPPLIRCPDIRALHQPLPLPPTPALYFASPINHQEVPQTSTLPSTLF